MAEAEPTKKIMEDFVVCYNSEVAGFTASSVKELTAMVTKSNRDLEGHRIWLVAGEGKPRRYYLRSFFLVDRIEKAKNNGRQTKIKGNEGKLLDPMPVLNDEEWFENLRRAQCNFRFGLRPIRDKESILGLERAAGLDKGQSEQQVLDDPKNGIDIPEETWELVPAPESKKTNRRRIVKNAKERRKKMIAFGWYGGKFSHLDFILPNLPTDAEHFCDVFGGSAAVLINRQPAPVETYNDIDEELTNFFETLRDDSENLIRATSLTLFSRKELIKALSRASGLSNLERARRFYVRARQTRTGLAQTSSEGRWAHCVLTSRAGMAGAVSRWLGAVEGLPEIVQRLQRVQIENAPALEVIERYDDPKTLFYLDPPYVHASRGDKNAYGTEMDDHDHRDLAEILNRIKGRAAISGYRTTLYDELFKSWRRIDATEKVINSSKGIRQESIWVNF